MAELIVALDVPTSASIPPVLADIGDIVNYYKVGLELYTAEGPQALRHLNTADKKIFLDLKMHDIPRTVARSVKTASRHCVSMLTIHACGGRDMMRAAADAAGEMGEGAPLLIAVTVLTSLSDADLRETGVIRSASEQVTALAELAVSCGIDGVVCSPLEAAQLRRALGPVPLLVTPGVRPVGIGVGDQKRIATPAEAVRNGSTHLVVGRPILEASNRASAAAAILEEMGDEQ